MDGAVAPNGGLVWCFAEFNLLPDLLALYVSGTDPHAVWVSLLDERGYNEDHVEDDEIPRGANLTDLMAEDALRLCRWIRLIELDGQLSLPGRQIANLALLPSPERGPHESAILTRILAQQAQAHYLGESDVPIINLLQGAAAVLASNGQRWPVGLYGMLLVEMATVIHRAFLDARDAELVALHDLARVREEVLAALRRDSRAVDGMVAANAIALVHFERENLSEGSGMAVTEMCATSIFLVFAELLRLRPLVSPPQVLCPVPLDDDAA